MQAFLGAADAGSESGRRISAAERLALLALPLPEGVNEAAATRLLDRYWGSPAPPDPPRSGMSEGLP